MKLPTLSPKRIAIGIAALCGIGIAWYLIDRYDVSLKDAREAIDQAPAWIFLLTLLVLPPVGFPLSIFLVAAGARFGLVYGSLAAITAIVGHHLIAIGLATFFSSKKASSKRGASLWAKLERKAGSDSWKMLLFWGLIPGPPYSVKLYLPLAMGASRTVFVKWCAAGHLIGTIIFVGLGEAILQGQRSTLIVVVSLAIILSVGLSLFRKKLFHSEETEPEPTEPASSTR